MENKVKISEADEATGKPAESPKRRFRISAEIVDKYLRFLVFLTIVGLVYIWNAHKAQKQIRTLDKLNTEIRELKSDYTSMNSDLSYGTRQSVIAEKVDTLGLKKLVEPPYKLLVNNE